MHFSVGNLKVVILGEKTRKIVTLLTRLIVGRLPGPERRDVMPFTAKRSPPKNAKMELTPEERDQRTVFIMQVGEKLKKKKNTQILLLIKFMIELFRTLDKTE